MCHLAQSGSVVCRRRRAAMGIVVTALVTLALWWLALPLARAQVLEPPRGRQGYYLALGPHFALTKSWERGRDWDVWPGYDITLRAGQMVTRRLGLGLQIHTGSSGGQGQSASLSGFSVEGQWELARHLAVRGGVGVDVLSLSTVGATDEAARGTVGSGFFLGASYDWFLTRRTTGGWAVTPVAQIRLLPGKTDGLLTTIGIELTYWTGLPHNQLDLAPGDAFKTKE